MKVHYAHGGGYTELGGMRTFLTKIRGDIDYEKIFPSKRPRKKPNYLNKDREKRKKKESGVSGKDLFKEILRRLEKKRMDREKVDVLVIIDDTDCKLSDKIAREKFFASLEGFKKKAKEVFEDMKIIFIWAEPEIERWFCIDRSSCFDDKRCDGKSLFIKIGELLREPLIYDEEKESCSEKFSEKFKRILNECGLSYSKRNDGSEYLKKVNPSKIEEEDKFAAKGIRELKNLSIRR